MNVLLLILLGFVAGAMLMAWACWATVHTKIDALEMALHDRFTAFETAIAAKLHKTLPPPAPLPAPPVVTAAASPATPAS